MPKKTKQYDGMPPGVVALQILKEVKFKTLRDTKEILYYDNGIYKPGGSRIAEEKASEICQTALTSYFCSEVLFHIQVHSYCDRDEFDKDINIINLKNGLFNIKTKELNPHNPNYLSMIQLPINYDHKADCPKTIKFLNEILEPKDVQTVLEAIGYCLYRSYPIHKAFMFSGSGSNGKSQLLELIRNFLGFDNCCSVPLQTLEYEKFSKAALYNKMANIFADLKSQALTDTGTFKTLTGGDTITAEKKFKDHFQFINYAKLIFSANNPPVITGDDSHAFWRRWILVNFPNQFTAGINAKVEIYKTLLDELPGLFNVAIDNLNKILEKGDFSYALTANEVASTYKKVSNSVQAFIDECCKLSPDSVIPKDSMYDQYLGFCKDYSLTPKDNTVFGTQLKKLCPDVESSRIRSGGKQVYVYKGVKVERQGRWEIMTLDE